MKLVALTAIAMALTLVCMAENDRTIELTPENLQKNDFSISFDPAIAGDSITVWMAFDRLPHVLIAYQEVKLEVLDEHGRVVSETLEQQRRIPDNSAGYRFQISRGNLARAVVRISSGVSFPSPPQYIITLSKFVRE